MPAEFISVENAQRWDDIVNSWPPQSTDVFLSAGYHRAFGSEQMGQGILYSYEQDSERLIYPFILRQIERIGGIVVQGGYHDIEGVYGFSGPVATTTDRAFLGVAWSAFDEWCRARRVVAEFVRFNPLLRNERFCVASMDITEVRQHVTLDLEQTEEEIWRSYSSVNRNMIRKAQNAGVACECAPLRDHLARFVDLYHSTMDRNQAASSYYFSRDQLATLDECVPCFACVASLGSEIVAASLFLTTSDRIHYHLSGCSRDGLKVAANNLILHATVLVARRQGLKTFHFGGGRTGSPDDPLLRFKANFSRQRVPVMIGRRVHDAPSYAELCALRRSQERVPQSFFLAYRYEGGGRRDA